MFNLAEKRGFSPYSDPLLRRRKSSFTRLFFSTPITPPTAPLTGSLSHQKQLRPTLVNDSLPAHFPVLGTASLPCFQTGTGSTTRQPRHLSPRIQVSFSNTPPPLFPVPHYTSPFPDVISKPCPARKASATRPGTRGFAILPLLPPPLQASQKRTQNFNLPPS